MEENLTEMVVHRPSLDCDRFYVQKEGKGFQRWREELISGTELECYLEDEQRWQAGTVGGWVIFDGSGNAPGAGCHYFFRWKDASGSWRCDLYDGLKVRLNVPTDGELRAAPKWCQGYNYGWHPAEDSYCSERGMLYVYPSGVEAWYCPEHTPKDVELATG